MNLDKTYGVRAGLKCYACLHEWRDVEEVNAPDQASARQRFEERHHLCENCQEGKPTITDIHIKQVPTLGRSPKAS